jgi:hypothetical protein
MKTPYEEYLPKLKSVPTHPQNATSDGNSPNLTTGSRKSQRRTKLPSRFKENDLDDENTPNFVRQLIDSKSTRYRTNPKCTLCPYSGKPAFIHCVLHFTCIKYGNELILHLM